MLISLPLQGQLSLRNDTILIKEVVINGNFLQQQDAGYKTTRLDTTALINYNNRTLADLISENTPIFIKTYDQGGIATPSLRGTSASHTQVAWNSINLNNPMVGQFDLSLVPAGFIDDVQIYYGGGSMSLNSSGIGGIINMETKPEWTKQNVFLLNPGLGSFGRYSGMVKVKAVKGRFQSVTKAFAKYSENNFRYLNNVLSSEPFWERRNNSQVNQKGFIQELYLKGSNSLLSAKFWYQSALRNLPVPMTTQPLNPCEKQDDESLRTMINYETSKGKTDVNVVAAFISDKLNYTNEVVSVSSKNISRRVILKSDIENRIGEKTTVRLGFIDEMNVINTNNYVENKSRNIAGVYASAESSFTPLLVSRVLVRETMYNHKILSPDFSAGAEYRLIPQKYYFIKINFSKISRVPSMNEMYWMPGGNPDLKNETGYTAELAGEWSGFLNTSLQIKGDLTYFRNHVYNLIQWHPGELTYWVADNVNELTTTGIESNVSFVYKSSKFNARFNTGYTFTKATGEVAYSGNDVQSGKQLVYVPVSQLNSVLKLIRGNVYTTVVTTYASRRFLTPDNSQYLPGYSVTDVNLGIRFVSRNVLYDINLLIENIFKANYQSIAYYPMPGRAYLVSVIFQLKK
jgi:outer membrane cobalamin receptor